MKNNFSAYYPPSEEYFQLLWDECIFILDANVLLNIYRYSPETRKGFLEILQKIQNRLWIPNQAAKEYHDNRLGVIKQQEKAYDKLIDSLNSYSEDINKILNRVKSDLNSYKKHPFIKAEKYSEKLDNISLIQELDEINKELEKNKKNHPTYTFREDDLMEEITTLLEGKVGPKFPPNKLEEIYKEGAKRYAREIPPGFKDIKEKDKNDNTKLKKYGDLIIWYQMIDKAKKLKKPIIFVTDDEKKGDWFLRINNSSFGPLPELIEEMEKEAKVNFYLYSANRFMDYSRKYLKFEVDQFAIDEVRDLGKYKTYESMKTKNTNDFLFESNFHQEQHLIKDLKKIENQLIDLEEMYGKSPIPINFIEEINLNLDNITHEIEIEENKIMELEDNLSYEISKRHRYLAELKNENNMTVVMYSKEELKHIDNRISKLHNEINSRRLILDESEYHQIKINKLLNALKF